MNIVFVTPHYKPYFGGIERVIEQLAMSFIKMGHRNEIHTTQWEFPRIFHSEWGSEDQFMEGTVRRFSTWPHVAPPFFQTPLVWVRKDQIFNRLNEYKPNLIVLMSDRWFIGNYWYIQWAKKNNIPVIFSLSFHTLSTMQQVLRPINNYLTNNASHVHVITNIEKDAIVKTYNTSVDKIAVIPWGANKVTHEPLVHDNNHINLLSVGRISHHKGQLFLAKQYLEANINKPSTLTFVGAHEDSDVVDAINNLEVQDNKEIIVTGHISDTELTDIYRKADLFILTPEYEAFGLVFIEALQQGIPVITHDVGAIKEVLGACEAVRISEPYSEKQLQDNLEDLCNMDDGESNELRKIAMDFVKKTYSWDKTAQAFLGLIEK